MFESIKTWPGRARHDIDNFMEHKMNFSSRQIALTWYYVRGLKEQLLAVVPISLLQILVLLIFFQQSIPDAGLQVMGLVLAIIGLTMFLDGLRVAIMPLAELVGEELPKRLPLPFVLAVAGFIGIIVTYAEPAISALRPLARLVDPSRAPYLFLVMNTQQELLVLAIGMGVGVAAVIGTLRFIKDWPLKPIIYMTFAPTVGATCYMQWGNPDLIPLIGVAWDCGGVTTGPVTVPILLALGIGVMRSSRRKKLAQAALEGSVAAGAGQALEGFGVVTLASLLPVLAVSLMAIIDGFIYPYDDVLAQGIEAAANPPVDGPAEISPLREVVYGVRSIMPLVVVLLFIVLVILRESLPTCSFWVDVPEDDMSTKSGDSSMSGKPRDALARTSVAIVKGFNDGASDAGDSTAGESEPDVQAAAEAGSAPKAGEEATVMPEKKGSKIGAWFVKNAPLLAGVLVTQLGMIMFNLGLTYGFTSLGSLTGTTLPTAYLEVPYDPESPRYSYAGGLILVMVTVFLLGVLATRAEPALNVLGRTVERLSGGAFTSKMLIGAVCVGVGIGMMAGGIKILYNLDLVYFILGKYTIALGLTIITDDAITAVAWDSAGVTTGPVTVPFVLAIGIGFSQAVDSTEGFGMLTTASVAPIISVLLTALLRKPAASARRVLSKQARSFARSVSGKRRLKPSATMAMAAFAMDAGASAGPTPDPSMRGGEAA